MQDCSKSFTNALEILQSCISHRCSDVSRLRCSVHEWRSYSTRRSSHINSQSLFLQSARNVVQSTAQLHYATEHWNDVIMSAMTSQITSLTIVYSSVYSSLSSKKTSKLHVTRLCEGTLPVTGEFPAQRASNAENAFIWWRHHGEYGWGNLGR